VLGGIGLNLGAIEGHMAQAHHAGLLTEAEDLNEQVFQRIKVAAPEFTDAAVVRLLVAGQYPEGQILVASPLDLPGRDDPHAIGVEQQHRHHPRVKALLAAWILGLSGDQDLGEIQLIHQIQQEIHLMVLSQPLTRRGRQQGGLIRLPGAERLGLLYAPCYRPDPVLSLGSWQIQGRLWRAAGRIYAQHAPRSRYQAGMRIPRRILASGIALRKLIRSRLVAGRAVSGTRRA